MRSYLLAHRARWGKNINNHFIGLDHIRALAAFMVFTWHFIVGNVYGGVWDTVPVPVYPFSILTQGHTGVALFITLSGYLFAKLLDKKNILYIPFIWTRFIRLAPLLILVVFIVGYTRFSNEGAIVPYLKSILVGLIKPTLPNGGWSVTVELHFYILLPFILYLDRRWKGWLCVFLIVSIIMKIILYKDLGDIQKLSYNTIIGRIDQFIFGIIAFKYRDYVSNQHVSVLFFLGLFLAFYSFFDTAGGLNSAPESIWIYLPLIEGAAYGLLISWYDNSFQHSRGGVSQFIAYVGKCSYSIYLLHFFFVWKLFSYVNLNIYPLSNIYINIAFSLICFLLMMPIASLSYHLIEKPFFRFKINYIKR